MTATAKQIAAELKEISETKQGDYLSYGSTAVHRIVRSLLAGSPHYVRSHPTEHQTGITDWSVKYNVAFDDLPLSDENSTLRIDTDPQNLGPIKEITTKGGSVTFSIEFFTLSIVSQTQVRSEWKEVDAETRKLVPVLDENDQPIVVKLPNKEVGGKIIGKLTVPLSFFVDLLIEIGRETLMALPPEGYIPQRLGENLANMLGSMNGGTMHPMDQFAQMIKARRAIMRGPTPDDHWGCSPMLWDGGRDFREQSTPCRLFIQPDDKGRMEIIAEPYGDEEIKQNAKERRLKEQWAEWQISQTETLKQFVFDRNDA